MPKSVRWADAGSGICCNGADDAASHTSIVGVDAFRDMEDIIDA